jgi:hypothetical protein
MGPKTARVGSQSSIFRRWKIVVLVTVVGLTGSLLYLLVEGRLLGVVVRVVEAVGRLGRR